MAIALEALRADESLKKIIFEFLAKKGEINEKKLGKFVQNFKVRKMGGEYIKMIKVLDNFSCFTIRCYLLNTSSFTKRTFLPTLRIF